MHNTYICVCMYLCGVCIYIHMYTYTCLHMYIWQDLYPLTPKRVGKIYLISKFCSLEVVVLGEDYAPSVMSVL